MNLVGYYLATIGPVVGIVVVLLGGFIELLGRNDKIKSLGHKLALYGCIALFGSLLIGFSICSITR